MVMSIWEIQAVLSSLHLQTDVTGLCPLEIQSVLDISEVHPKLLISQSKLSGPCCSKLTMSLVNVSLKFQILIPEIRQYFLLKQCEKLLQCKSFSHFFNKSISIFSNKVIKNLRS